MEHRLRAEGSTGLDVTEGTTPSRTIFPLTILIMVKWEAVLCLSVVVTCL
jgi:hypothetical protein